MEAFSPVHSSRRQAWPQTVTSRQVRRCALHGPGPVWGLCMVAVAARSTASPRAAAALRERDLHDTQHLWSLPVAANASDRQPLCTALGKVHHGQRPWGMRHHQRMTPVYMDNAWHSNEQDYKAL